jgi:hypothetical protein
MVSWFLLSEKGAEFWECHASRVTCDETHYCPVYDEEPRLLQRIDITNATEVSLVRVGIDTLY